MAKILPHTLAPHALSLVIQIESRETLTANVADVLTRLQDDAISKDDCNSLTKRLEILKAEADRRDRGRANLGLPPMADIFSN